MLNVYRVRITSGDLLLTWHLSFEPTPADIRRMLELDPTTTEHIGNLELAVSSAEVSVTKLWTEQDLNVAEPQKD